MARETVKDIHTIKQAYDHIFNSGIPVSKLRDAAVRNRLLSTDNDLLGAPGRSIAWKLFLSEGTPLQPSESTSLPSVPLSSLRVSRTTYSDLLAEKLRAPDGTYEDDLLDQRSPRSAHPEPVNLDANFNNPLSLHDENPWTAWFAAMDLKKTISQDVERTFPDIDYFRDTYVQRQLTNILFIYSLQHPTTGYRQGMHEILACVYYAVDHDAKSANSSDDKDPSFLELVSSNWVSADAWALFESIMRGLGSWYEWRDSPLSLGSASPSPAPTPVGPLQLKPAVLPILAACTRIQSSLLKTVDPLLWRRLDSTGIEPQIYGMRWLRLLFTREFPLQDAMILWDGMFASADPFDLALWICVAMLIRIRNELMSSDYTGQLTVLLRYPASNYAPEVHGESHPMALLLKQALALQLAPTAASGASLVMENRNLLGIAVEVPEPVAPTRPQKINRGRSSTQRDGSPIAGPGPFTHARHRSAQTIRLPELLGGLLERGESLGINKTVMSAVSELRRNLPDIASTLTRSPNGLSDPDAAFALVGERPVEEDSPWQTQSRFIERETETYRSNNQKLGDSVAAILDTLEQDESAMSGNELDQQQNKKRRALDSLAYVRDVLKSGKSDTLDNSRLYYTNEPKVASELRIHPPSPRSQFPSPSLTSPRNIQSQPSLSRQGSSFLKGRFPLPSSPSPHTSPLSTPGETTDTDTTRLASWNSTKSNLVGSALPLPSLSRSPHRTSNIPSSASQPATPVSSLSTPKLLAKPKASPRKVIHDPLGVSN